MNIQFHLTNKCNLRCKHCYQDGYNEEIISLSNFEIILKKTRSFFESIGSPLGMLALTGGEPLCVPGILDYVHTSSLYFKDLRLLSNGLLLKPGLLDELKKIKGFSAVQVSLEGPKDVNDNIRGKGTYEKIRKAIKLINDADLQSIVSCTLAPYNYNRVVELYDDLVAYDPPDVLWFDRCIPFKKTDVLTSSQFKEFIGLLSVMRKRWEEEKLLTVPLNNRALQWFSDKNSCCHYVCGAGMRHFTIMYDGSVMVCRRLDFSIGNLLKEDWSDIIGRSYPLIEAIHKLPDECQDCAYSDSCNGGLKCLTYFLYKDFNKKDVNCCLTN